MEKHEEIYIVTDGCMWEQNKQNATYYPHAIEVVNQETGQVRYIKSGSRIAFLKGEISENRDQKAYNKAITKMPDNVENELYGTNSKTGGRGNVKKKSDKD